MLVRDRASSAKANYATKAVVRETGARAFFAADIKELAGIYGLIADELANQYLLAYFSSNPRVDGTYRRLSVRVGRPGVRTRTRTGYVAAPPSPIALR